MIGCDTQNHGVLACGESVAHAFAKLYYTVSSPRNDDFRLKTDELYTENDDLCSIKAAEIQILAMQAATASGSGQFYS